MKKWAELLNDNKINQVQPFDPNQYYGKDLWSEQPELNANPISSYHQIDLKQKSEVKDLDDDGNKYISDLSKLVTK